MEEVEQFNVARSIVTTQNLLVPHMDPAAMYLNVTALEGLNVVKAHPSVKKFIHKLSDQFQDWDYTCFNRNMKTLLINPFFYTMYDSGIKEAKQGDRGKYLVKANELDILDLEDIPMLERGLLNAVGSQAVENDHYLMITSGFHFLLIDKDLYEENSNTGKTEFGAGLNNLMTDYIQKHFFGVDIQIPYEIELLLDLLIDLIGVQNLSMYASGNPFLLYDELLNYFSEAQVAGIYKSADVLSSAKNIWYKEDDPRHFELLHQVRNLQSAAEEMLEQALMQKRTSSRRRINNEQED